MLGIFDCKYSDVFQDFIENFVSWNFYELISIYNSYVTEVVALAFSVVK